MGKFLFAKKPIKSCKARQITEFHLFLFRCEFLLTFDLAQKGKGENGKKGQFGTL